MCQVWGEQIRLLLSKRVQVQHRPRGVHVQVQLRHLWYRQVRFGVSSWTQVHMIRDYLHARVHPAPANSLPNFLVSKYYIFGRCGVNSWNQVPMFRDYLHAWVHPLALEHQSLEFHGLPPGRVITKIHPREI
jgi:hypothetical protein